MANADNSIGNRSNGLRIGAPCHFTKSACARLDVERFWLRPFTWCSSINWLLQIEKKRRKRIENKEHSQSSTFPLNSQREAPREKRHERINETIAWILMIPCEYCNSYCSGIPSKIEKRNKTEKTVPANDAANFVCHRHRMAIRSPSTAITICNIESTRTVYQVLSTDGFGASQKKKTKFHQWNEWKMCSMQLVSCVRK